MPRVNKINKFKEVCQLAIENGGICLDNTYHNSKTKMNFKCAKGHIFSATPSSILYAQTWCAECSGNVKLDINKINKLFKYDNMICISDIYLGNKKKLNWKCIICNAIFQYSKNEMDKDFTSCQNCYKINALKLVQEIAESRGGKCLSEKYILSTDKMKFLCANNHLFETKYYNIIWNGTWCSQCNDSNYISEEICRAYFEQMFSESFIKIRPDWLKNNNGYKLELDGFCEKLNLAFEHNGTQHYKDIYNDPNTFNKLLENDKEKISLCNKLNITLIIIPELFIKTPLFKLRDFIINKCMQDNIKIPFPNIKIDLTKLNKNDFFQIYKNIAIERGGKCISTEYLGSVNAKLIWECKDGHRWAQFPYVLQRGHWCPFCAKINRMKDPDKIKNMHELGRSKYF
jgi:hypothetical protein